VTRISERVTERATTRVTDGRSPCPPGTTPVPERRPGRPARASREGPPLNVLAGGDVDTTFELAIAKNGNAAAFAQVEDVLLGSSTAPTSHKPPVEVRS
jgi:hypothetical protein